MQKFYTHQDSHSLQGRFLQQTCSHNKVPANLPCRAPTLLLHHLCYRVGVAADLFVMCMDIGQAVTQEQL